MTETAPGRRDAGTRSVLNTSIGDILDETQGHLILRWDAWRSQKPVGMLRLSAIYCLLALFLLTFFATDSFLRQETRHAQILLSFAIVTVLCFVYLRTSRNVRRTNSFIVALLGALCLFLMYTGGIQGTGPLWYFAFPPVALFIQRLWAGLMSVTLLFLATLAMISWPAPGFDPSIYSAAFIVRLFAVYLTVSVMSFFYAYIRTSTELHMDNVNRDIRNLANTDELTLLPNRRRMTEILYQEVARTRRNRTTFSIIIFDVDHFKRVNDVYGHDAGDRVLGEIKDITLEVLRTQDICARWGGEEFLVLLPETGITGARRVAERLRVAFEAHAFVQGEHRLPITVSLGVYESSAARNLEDCLKQADKNLYLAKHAGRNRVVAGDEDRPDGADAGYRSSEKYRITAPETPSTQVQIED